MWPLTPAPTAALQGALAPEREQREGGVHAHVAAATAPLPAPLFQFCVYSAYFLALSIAYFLAAVLGGLQHLWRGHHQPLPLAQELRSPLEEKATQARGTQPGAAPQSQQRDAQA